MLTHHIILLTSICIYIEVKVQININIYACMNYCAETLTERSEVRCAEAFLGGAAVLAIPV